jgi:hypothetical protein
MFVSCACCVLCRWSLRRADRSFRGILPGVSVCMWSRNPNNEAAWAWVGQWHHKKKMSESGRGLIWGITHDRLRVWVINLGVLKSYVFLWSWRRNILWFQYISDSKLERLHILNTQFWQYKPLKVTQMVTTPNHTNPVHTPTPHFFKIHFCTQPSTWWLLNTANTPSYTTIPYRILEGRP